MIARGYQKSKRDANEREMIEAWRACGALCIRQDETAGFDVLLLTKEGAVYFVEIKDIRQDHNKFYLTDAERKRRVEVQERGGCYKVITNMVDALALVGAA